MKLVNVKSSRADVTVLLDWDNVLQESCPQLSLKKGDSLSVFYANNKRFYTFTPIPYYTKPYHPQEKLDNFIARKPVLKKWIEIMDLELTI